MWRSDVPVFPFGASPGSCAPNPPAAVAPAVAGNSCRAPQAVPVTLPAGAAAPSSCVVHGCSSPVAHPATYYCEAHHETRYLDPIGELTRDIGRGTLA